MIHGFFTLLAMLPLFAEGGADGQGAQPGGGLPGLLLTLLPILVLFYFLMIRPARRQEQERQSLLGALKKNDKVVTVGGLIGIVSSIKENEDEVTLKVDENSNVKVRVTKASIVRVLTASSEGAKEAKEGG